MRPSFRFLAILACALPLACSDTSTTPTAAAPPVPRFEANPASNGTMIYRYGWDAWWFWPDVDKQLVAVHGSFDPVQGFCYNNWFGNGTSWQDVVSGKYGEGEWLVHMLVRAPEAYIYVYSGTLSTINFCQPLAGGTGHFVSTDSDVNADQSDRLRANAWGVRAEGKLVGQDGQLYHYNAHFLHTWRPADPSTSHEQVLINLQPIGR